VPIIGDFNYNGHVLLTKYPECPTAALEKVQMNRGTLARGSGADRTVFDDLQNGRDHGKRCASACVNGGSRIRAGDE